MAAALKLISHKLCPYVQRAVIALNEKGVPFERIDIDLANKPDWFLKISPLGKVPVLLVATADGEAALFESKRQAVAAKFARVEEALGAGPYFAGESFSLVDAVFAPIFRYFDVFDQLTDLSVFADTPKVRAWRKALAQRPSVRTAVGPDYPQLLHAFLVRYDAHLLKLAA